MTGRPFLISLILILLCSVQTMVFAADEDLLDLLLSSRKGPNKDLLVKASQVPSFFLGQVVFMKDEHGTTQVGKIRNFVDDEKALVKWKRRDGETVWLFNFPEKIEKKYLTRKVPHPFEGKTVHVPAYHYYLKVGEVSAVFDNNLAEINYGSHRPRRYYHLTEIAPEVNFPEQGWSVEMKNRSGDLLQGIALRQFENGLVEVDWQRKNGSKKHIEFIVSPYVYLSDPPQYHYVHRSRLSFYPGLDELSFDFFSKAIGTKALNHLY